MIPSWAGRRINVIQPTTGAKVDLVPLPRDSFTRAAFGRRQRLEYDEAGHAAMFITPEDIIVAKLAAYRETGSDKHLRDEGVKCGAILPLFRGVMTKMCGYWASRTF